LKEWIKSLNLFKKGTGRSSEPNNDKAAAFRSADAGPQYGRRSLSRVVGCGDIDAALGIASTQRYRPSTDVTGLIAGLHISYGIQYEQTTRTRRASLLTSVPRLLRCPSPRTLRSVAPHAKPTSHSTFSGLNQMVPGTRLVSRVTRAPVRRIASVDPTPKRM
jgi:hypothetical protein